MLNRVLRFIRKNQEIVVLAVVLYVGWWLYADYQRRTTEGFAGGNGMVKVIFFHADWCGHCQDFKPEWRKFKQAVKENTNYEGKVMLKEYNSDKDKEVFAKYNVKAFPHIILETTDGHIREFKGGRNKAELVAFLNDNME